MTAEPSWTLDHCSLTVPDLEAAVDFFVTVVGARVRYYRRVLPGADPTTMQMNFNAHPAASFRLARLEISNGPGLELFEYSTPDQIGDHPRNCDVGGTHLGFHVDDIDIAVERLRDCDNVFVLGETQELPTGHPLGGRKWIHFLTPWGQQMELVDDSHRR